MNSSRQEKLPETGDSFTSFTSGCFAEVNEIIDRRSGFYPLLFTSFTSFSEVCGIHAGGRAPGRPRFRLTAPRRTGERGERDGDNATPSLDYLVHFTDFDEVNEARSFTSAGVFA